MRGFYGPKGRKNYFEGYYFKQSEGRDTVAVIPAVHTDAFGRGSASVQVVCNEFSGFARMPFDMFEADERGFSFRVGKCAFSARGLELSLRTSEMSACGKLVFGPLTPLSYSVMGPFALVPGMQCVHRVVSMAHSVFGSLTVNGRRYAFDGAPGYIEGDRGSSFPERYLWTHFASDKDALSLMLSVADIPFGFTKFTGILCPILFNGKEYRLATYLGARLVSLGKKSVCVKQGAYTFRAELLYDGSRLLRAPVNGSMERRIRESPSCTMRYVFEKGGETLFDVTGESASFECEYPGFDSLSIR